MSAPVPRQVRPRPLLWLASGCACVLVGLLALEYHSGVAREISLAHPSDHVATAARAAGPDATAGSSPTPIVVQDWTKTVLARPLFSPSRRPAATVAAGPQQPRLAGIVMGPSGRRAIFAGEGDARGIVAEVGQQAGAWQIRAINETTVQVIGPEGLRTLTPSRDSAARADNDGSAAGTPTLPTHPSILDLLRNRSLQIGPANASMPHLPTSLQLPRTPPNRGPIGDQESPP